MLSISRIRKFLIERLPPLRATAARRDNSVHAYCVERLVHCVAEATARPVVVPTARAGRSVHPSSKRFRGRVHANRELKVLASHATVIVSVCEHTSEKLRVTLQSFWPPSGG